jgi:hypothetical protein
MPEFIPGLELCRLFYIEAVRPILDREFPGLRYSASRIDSGSEVLGFDTEMSTDHDWGPRLLLFLEEEEANHGASPKFGCRGESLAEAIRETLSQQLPPAFRGYSTSYAPNDDGTLTLDASVSGTIRHRVETITVSAFFRAYLNLDIRQPIEAADWLTFPEQKLRTITCGTVYHDAIGLQSVVDRFAYYPRDVWLYLLAAGWTRIGQEEHLMGRAGSVGDELGSALIGSRLVRDLMRLCFLMERQYAPYPKWFGTAFHRLECAACLEPVLRKALRAETWQDRESSLVAAYEIAAAMHNALAITNPLPIKSGPFHNRPFRVIHLESDFAGALCRQIQDPAVQRIAARRLIGSIDQFSDSTELLSSAQWRPTLKRLYE